MDPAQWVQLITQGGAIVVLSAGIWAFLTGRIKSKPSADAETTLWRERLADTAADRDEWKAIAKAAVDGLDRQAEAMEARNRRDERAARKVDR